MIYKLWENLKMALRAIKSNKLRSFLTTLGVVIGVLAISELLAIGEGVKKDVARQIQGLGTNVLAVVAGKITPGKQTSPSAALGANALKLEDVEAIKKLPEVEAAAPIMLVSGIPRRDKTEDPTAISIATTSEFAKVREYELEKGRFINEDDLNQKKRVLVLGSKAKEILLGEKEVVGQEITFQNEEFEIIGVLKPEIEALSFAGSDFNNILIMPLTTAEELTGNLMIFRILLKTFEANQVENTKEKVKQILMDNHGGSEDFSVLTQEDMLDIFNTIFGVLTAMVAAIASISLVVGGIGIMNIMLVAVTERTREIGLRKALGASNLDILSQFFIEALVICLLGGFIGIALSWGIAFLIKIQTELNPYFSFVHIFLALSFALGVGIIFGLAPAIRAARLNPSEALRYE